jgi:hypothetical protein
MLVASGGLVNRIFSRSISEGARMRASWIALISAGEAVNGVEAGNGVVEVDDVRWLSNGDAAAELMRNSPRARRSRVLNIL